MVLGALSCTHLSTHRSPSSVAEFRTICQARVELKKADPTICDSISGEFFKSDGQAPSIAPGDLGAPVLPTDYRTKIIAIAAPRYFSQLAYCYFQYRGWFDPKALPPEKLSVVASGFAILKNELEGYGPWLDTDVGRECRQRVSGFAGEDVTDLDSLFRSYDSLIAVNPIAAIKEGVTLEDVKKDALATVNHERIHVLHVLCQQLDEVAVKMWSELDARAKGALQKKFLSYDWSNPTVAVRENLALRYEHNPLEVLNLANGCHF